MTEQKDQDLLSLYRQSSREEPSALLDQRVRKAAQQAIRSRRPGWKWGLSTAAVLVLSFSVVLQMYFDEGMPEETMDTTTIIPLNEQPSDLAGELAMDVPIVSQQSAALPAAPVSKLKRSLQKFEEAEADAITAPTTYEIAADFMPEASAETGMAKPEDANVRLVTVPELPFDAAGLRALDSGLTVEQSGSGIIIVYSDNKLVLSIRREGDNLSYRASSGSERLGIKLDWSITPSQLDTCEAKPVYKECQMGQGVTGYFEGDRLDFIQWQRPS